MQTHTSTTLLRDRGGGEVDAVHSGFHCYYILISALQVALYDTNLSCWLCHYMT